MRKELKHLHDMAKKTIDVPTHHVAVIQEDDGDITVTPCPWLAEQKASEPFRVTLSGHERIAVLKPGDVTVVDCADEFKVPDGMCGSGYRRISYENRGGIAQRGCVGRYVLDGRGWMGWADEPEWIDDDGTRIAAPTQPETTVTLDSVHDHAAKHVRLPPGHYLVSQLACYHPAIHPDPLMMRMNPDAYWKDGRPEEGIVRFGERVTILTPGDEITVHSDRTLIGYVRPEEYREERFRNINGRIKHTVLQQHVVE